MRDSKNLIQKLGYRGLYKKHYPISDKEVFDKNNLESRLDDLEQFNQLEKSSKEDSEIKYKAFEEVINNFKITDILTKENLEQLISEIFWSNAYKEQEFKMWYRIRPNPITSKYKTAVDPYYKPDGSGILSQIENIQDQDSVTITELLSPAEDIIIGKLKEEEQITEYNTWIDMGTDEKI